MKRPAHLPSYLTDRQLEAVLHVGSPLLVIAGPGSGKTAVITWRVTHLVKTELVTPAHCLVTTFANRAAIELQDRIEQNLRDSGSVRAEADIAPMRIGTFHSLCADILREYQSRSALPRGFRILDDSAQFLFVYTNRKELGLDALVKGRPHDLFRNVLRLFDRATQELVRPKDLLSWCRKQQKQAEKAATQAAKGKSKTKAQKAADQVELWMEEAIVTQSYQAYCKLLAEHSLVDFAFLQRHALELLDAHPDAAAELRERYREILVDEYQDTDATQEKILQHLAGGGQHLTVVGDDDQSIYRFRGATVRNLLTFNERYAGAHWIVLNENFRSREPIVEHSLNVITQNPARFQKDLFTLRGTGSDVLLAYEHSVAEEAAAIARLLRNLHETGRIRRWSDVTFLLRSVKSYAKEYRLALEAEGIPVCVIGDATLFERQDVDELYNLFSFLGTKKPWGDVRVRCSLMGWGDATCAALQAYTGSLLDLESEDDVRGIGVDASDCPRLAQLIALKRRVQAKEHASLLEVFYALLAVTQHVARGEMAGRVEPLINVGIMSGLVAAFDEHGGTHNLFPFQDYLQLMKEGGIDPAVIVPDDAVQIMTIHQAKGLEFPAIVIGSVMDGRLPSMRRRDPYEIPDQLRASGPPEVEDPHMVDERRLFYVAATRARELLVLGTADIVNKRGGGPSPFLTEMFGADLHRAADLSRARVLDAESPQRLNAAPRERLSFSELAYYFQCPVRFKFAHVYGLVVPPPDPLDFGANVHRALHVIHERAREGKPPAESEIAGIVEQTWLATPQVSAARDRQIKKAAVKQLESYVARYGDTFDQVDQCEAQFSFGLGQNVLLGKIDLVRRVDERYEVVDFKVGKPTPLAMQQVTTQLDFYAMGAQTSLGLTPQKQTVHFLQDNQVSSWDWTEQKAASARQHLSGALDCIARRELPPRTQFCSDCAEFRSICPYAK